MKTQLLEKILSISKEVEPDPVIAHIEVEPDLVENRCTEEVPDPVVNRHIEEEQDLAEVKHIKEEQDTTVQRIC